MTTFRVYIRYPNQSFSDKTATSNPDIAIAAWNSIRSRKDLIGTKAALVLSRDNRGVYYHRFDRSEGDAQFVPEGIPLELFGE
jgi:hypothetical protein